MADPTGQPSGSPSQVPTFAPTEYVLVVPSWILVILVLGSIFCICFALLCCRKGDGYKKKIYDMMDEAKLDQDKDQMEGENDDDDDYYDDEDTL